MGQGVDVETEPGAEFDEADHPDRVLDEAEVGLADRSEHPFFDVWIALDVVYNSLMFRIVEEAVDGEVPSQDVLFFGTPLIIPDDQVGSLGVARSKGGDLDDFLAEADMGKAESAADEDGVSEEGADLFGLGRRRDVEVLGALA